MSKTATARLSSFRAVRSVQIAFQDQLSRSGWFDTDAFERSLIEAGGYESAELGDLAIRMLSYPQVRFAFLFWMQNNSTAGLRVDFKQHLAQAYLIDDYDKDRGQAIAEFYWREFPQHRGMVTGLEQLLWAQAIADKS